MQADSMPHVYRGPELQTAVSQLPGWQIKNDALTRQWTFPDFIAAIEFVNAVAKIAETIQHHPDIEIHYNKVQLALSTHDAGGITDADLEFATRLNQEFGR